MDFDQIFESAEKILNARLEAIRSAINHAGMKGAAVENAVMDLLREYLPKNLAMGSGIVIDQNYNSSKQIDIIIYDAAKTPTFLSSEGMVVVPIECGYFAIEVKTKLTKDEFEKCVSNMDAVKSLEKTSFYKKDSPVESTFHQYSGRVTAEWEVIYIVFALEGVDKNTIVSWLDQHRRSEREIHKQIDTVYVGSTGAFVNTELQPPNSFKPSLLPSKKSLIDLQEENSLTYFMGLFSIYYNQADINGRFNFLNYLRMNAGAQYISTPRNKEILESAQRSGFQVEVQKAPRKIKPTTMN